MSAKASFSRLLIANRGEIACRIIRTARRMGMATIAVHSQADRDALHVSMADMAVEIGPAPARESYLAIDRILEAARRAGADAVHPGYGFLSENAEFAEACLAAGLVFVGAPAAAIRAMGSKADAKALMERSGVPLVPGYHGADQDGARLAAEAARIGYPVLIKASAGGGGKGMRIVERAQYFEAALAAAQREAEAAFGDQRVLIEKYLVRPRHVEIQIFADAHGTCLSLFERDCSIQRRHQKIIEEAPAPGLDPALRASMGAAAVEAARAVGYVGAGTVEFILAGNAFHFMEMNTRLQVEHPVTEMITGLDLVELQLRIAAGEKLPFGANDLRIDGHAIEARLYAEDPSRDFLPATGRLDHLAFPQPGPELRIETGVREGDSVTPFYDPMLAKIIVHGATRAEAVARLATALERTQVVGPATNLALLRAIARHDAFRQVDLDTGFLARHPDCFALRAPEPDAADAIVAAALLARFDEITQPSDTDPHSPWARADAFRLNGSGAIEILLERGGETLTARIHPGASDTHEIIWNGRRRKARLERDGRAGFVTLDGVRRAVTVVAQGDMITILMQGFAERWRILDPLAPPQSEGAGEDRLTAPIPARVTRVLAASGEAVQKGALLLVLEAMKMEIPIRAPHDGRIARMAVSEGEMVEEGAELVSFAAE